jgi:soluble lytic murein transglycosylase-like protein
MRRSRSHTGYGSTAPRSRAANRAGSAALPTAAWVAPIVALLILAGSTIHAARVVGRPLMAQLALAAAPAQPPAAPADGPSVSLLGFAPTVQRWAADIERWAGRAGLDPLLVATVMQIESCGDPNAISPAGALGLFQVMPYHFSDRQDPLDPATNAEVGLDYLARAMALAGGNVSLALAGYNGGHGIIGQPPSQWPDEAARYVRWGSGIVAEAPTGAHPTLDRWLAAGGEHLCRQAASQFIQGLARATRK